jgi:Family of unknown function (DUF5686)/Carboxypeptidase regulatory-like domain
LNLTATTFGLSYYLKYLYIITICLLGPLSVLSQRADATEQNARLQGILQTPDGSPVAFAAIASTNEQSGKLKGTTSDEEGRFLLELPAGRYTIKAHMLGFTDVDTLITLVSGKTLRCELIMKEKVNEMSSVSVFANRKDMAREVAGKAIDARAHFLEGTQVTLNYQSYMHSSIQTLQPDTASVAEDTLSGSKRKKEKDRPLIRLQYKLFETNSEIHMVQPSKWHERVVAAKDFTKDKPRTSSAGASMSMSFGEAEIVPQQWMYDDSYVLKSISGFTELSIYHRLLDVPSITEKKILSPIGEGALLSYRYDLESLYKRDSVTYYVIAIEPLFPNEPLFGGSITVRSSDWMVTECTLNLKGRVTKFFSDFRMAQSYELLPEGIAVIAGQRVQYVIVDGRTTYEGRINVKNSDFRQPDVPFRFSDETRNYDELAFDRDSAYWASNRLVTMDAIEMGYAQACDSLQRLYATDDYYHEIDSTYNAVRWNDILLYGIGFRNREKDYSLYLNPLTMQVNPLGIGGYRHRVGGSLQKEFSNAYKLEMDGEVDYGFRNQDLRGKMGVGLTYRPLKFVRTFLRVGDFYDMVNSYASLGSIFSRSNYVRTQMWSVAQRMEIVNGLFAELSFEFSDQKPIVNLQSDRWSQTVFGDVNTPIAFERYIKSEFRLDVKYRHKQKYMIRKGKKILLGSVYPEVSAVYRKGVPGILGSEVDFDYAEIGLKQSKELGRIGNFDWSVLAGSFINKTNLRILEHRYFRGSDVFFFSDPLRSFQLLGPTLSTANAFFRANYFHHFNGLLLSKIPLLARLKLTEAIGAAMLSIPKENFHHAEFYAGIERIVRIRKDLFRFGIYAATADSNWEKAKFEWKLGVNFYNAFTKKWQY